MSGPTVEFVGADEALADMRRWADQVAPEIARASDPFAQRVADLVAGKVPVVSGALAASVETGDDVAGSESGVTVSIGEGLRYAGWIEFGGTRGRPYVPSGRYLYPTALAAQDEYAALAADTAADSVGRFSWS